MIVSCECGAKLKIDDAKISDKGVKVRCPRCGNVIPVQRPSSASSVPPLENSTLPIAASLPRYQILWCWLRMTAMLSGRWSADFLIDAGFRVDTAADGVEALKKAMENKPQGMVLDVGLPGIYGFELCERLKGIRRPGRSKIVLLSSVYDMRRYKRTPTNLYGADDYIEKHHIPDFLVHKLRKLIFPEQFDVELSQEQGAFSPRPAGDVTAAGAGVRVVLAQSRNTRHKRNASSSSLTRFHPGPQCRNRHQMDGQEGAALFPESLSLDASIFQKEECDIPRVDEADPEAVEKARRFAGSSCPISLSIIRSAVIEGLMKGTFYDLLKQDVDEGRELYEGRVPGAHQGEKGLLSGSVR